MKALLPLSSPGSIFFYEGFLACLPERRLKHKKKRERRAERQGPARYRPSQEWKAGHYLSLVAGLAPERLMRAFIVRPGRTAQRGRIMSHHEGEEILFILTGKIELHIGKRKEVLSPGDCVQFESTIPHKLTAMTAEPASALVVIAANGD
ncbi:cupin domain-containing protein [Bradyrhizobium sp. CCGB12]|uniref:cupin domain-containing protein n=1 Tax=Bradyrhizobium sp. CCGB12 TaxID=2949632 RepID=UPI0020B2E5A6|nr:cupin domain-containing protein [Bradyrhizobium sp. CCGB12]MCP3392374.1 cupin domain-containing protein [Bradyrhizobium sp. CCGB12]